LLAINKQVEGFETQLAVAFILVSTLSVTLLHNPIYARAQAGLKQLGN